MGIHKQTPDPHTLPASSDFQFIISLSPPTSTLRPADELFYNGQLLPLHLSPRTSMVRTLLTTTARHSSPSDPIIISNHKKPLITKQFSFNKFSSVFRKETKPTKADPTNVTFRDKIRKYMKKLSQFHAQKTTTLTDTVSYSFSGNLRFLTKTSCVSSCPPSPKSIINGYTNGSTSSTEELQSAIQGAILHCKNSMSQ